MSFRCILCDGRRAAPVRKRRGALHGLTGLVRCRDCRLVQQRDRVGGAVRSHGPLTARPVAPAESPGEQCLVLGPRREPSTVRTVESRNETLLLQSGLKDAPFMPASLATVVLSDLLGYLEDPFGTMQTLRSLLRPAGLLLVSVPLLEAMGRNESGNKGLRAGPRSLASRPIAWFDRSSLSRLLGWAGFDIVDWRRTSPGLDPLAGLRAGGGQNLDRNHLPGEASWSFSGAFSGRSLGLVPRRLAEILGRGGWLSLVARRPSMVRLDQSAPDSLHYWDRRGSNTSVVPAPAGSEIPQRRPVPRPARAAATGNRMRT